jgi:intracellular multiplication protein IcmS
MDISEKLCAIAKTLKANFTLNGKPITYEEVFSVTGLLPALCKRADQLSSLCLGYGIGSTYEDTEQSKLGVKVKFDESTPDILRYLFITDVVSEIMASAPSRDQTPLDELMYD